MDASVDLPQRLALPGHVVTLERASAADVPAVVALLRDDPIGAGREAAPDAPGGEGLAPYREAFAAVDADPHQLLVVVRSEEGQLVGTLQLTLLHGLSRGGATRLQVEAVRVAAGLRGSGLGRALLAWAAAWGRAHGAVLAQLTTDLRREDARRFYEGLGWVHSHAGLKLDLR
ncbi:GNAT family N-acetyltransferase [Arthrobacter sp. NEB 688]|uniref:GNAT family N-acetyltransferase n=1 Tax=Arthrobacter sp. NEB 688 TaxID=904039 RepID=UPI002570125B|nr:GNAT family N-acetyltransferase [Arthrobacter sp. NEB 688]